MWCKRPLTASTDTSSTAFTRDHLYPKSKGGVKWYPCCKACNHVKADLTPEEWDTWRADHPEWWKLWPRYTARSYYRMKP